MDKLIGKVKRVIYKSDDFNICSVSIDDSDKNGLKCLDMVVSVNHPNIKKGFMAEFSGEFDINSKYGKQFKAKFAIEQLPDTSKGFKVYLKSGLFKGIGEVTANKIVDFLGDNPVGKIKDNPDIILDVPGVKKTLLEGIKEVWLSNTIKSEIIVFLQQNGITGVNLEKIYDRYRENSIAVITKNPYILIEEIDGIGFRMDDDTFTTSNDLLATFSPRVSLSYEFAEDWRLSGAAGRYYKIAPYTILGFRDTNGFLTNQDSDYTRSDHFVLGLQHYLSPSASISIEGFYKRYSDYPVSVLDQVSLANKGAGFEVLGNEDIETVGKGKSYGLELQYQQKLSNNFYSIFSYTYFFSEFTGFDTSLYIPSVWDSRHLASFVGGYKLKRNWEISSRYRFAGRTPFVPVDLNATLNSYPQIILDYARLGEEKLEAFSQLDIRVDKKWNYQKWSLNIFFEVQNILGQNIPTPPEYGLLRDMDGNLVNPRSLSQIEEDGSATIPSIGIVVDF